MPTLDLGELGLEVELGAGGTPKFVTVTLPDGSAVTKHYGDGKFDMRSSLRLIMLDAAGSSVPRLVAGLNRWHDPSDPTTITAGAGVSALRDKSGNGYDALQATGANQPTTGTINGRTALAFDGTSELHLQSTAGITPFDGSDKPFTIFAVVETAALDVGRTAIGFGRASGGNGHIGLGVENTGPSWRMTKQETTGGVQLVNTGGTPVLSTPTLLTAVCDGTRVTVRANGAVVIVPTSLDVTAATLGTFNIGAWNSNGTITSMWSGKIGENLV
jgi:hypothetical protein